MFCGRYVTPVDDDYFERLERLRGEGTTTTTSSSKMNDDAKQALLMSITGEKEVRMAAKGVEVDFEGKVIPILDEGEDSDRDQGQESNQNQDQEAKETENGRVVNVRKRKAQEDGAYGNVDARSKDTDEEERVKPVRDRMDISLHNFGDYADRGYN